MKIFDMHCDTIYRLYFENNGGDTLRKNIFQVDLNKLRKTGAMGQFFALFFDAGDERELKPGETPWEVFKGMHKLYKQEIGDHQDLIREAFSYEDILLNKEKGLLSGILTIEGAESIMGSMEKLEEVHRLGVRLITLTWNHENELAYPNIRKEFRDLGLKPRGIEAIQRMNELGMIIDVSHLSDGGFWDVFKHSSKPFIASHSNARDLWDHPRNLTDDMIRALAEKGGVTGLNFCSSFLDGSKLCKVDDLVNHALYIINKGGIDSLALGTDFDGIGNDLEIEDIGQMEKLDSALKKGGLTSSQLEKIYNKNILRVFKDTVG